MHRKKEIEIDSFENKKHTFFTRLGLSIRQQIKLHMRFGLFEKINNNIGHLDRRHQAPEHMLVVTARAQVLADWLNLNKEIKDRLTPASALHDAFKAKERLITEQENFTWSSFENAQAAGAKALEEAGVGQSIIDLTHAAGHPCNEAQRRIALENPSSLDWAWLVLFYVDSYTSGVDWATNRPIEERFFRDRDHYPGFNTSAVGEIDGHPTEEGFPALIRIANEAQEKIAKRIGEISGRVINPMILPLMVDNEIKQRIDAIK